VSSLAANRRQTVVGIRRGAEAREAAMYRTLSLAPPWRLP
jgi:hypothetical protein